MFKRVIYDIETNGLLPWQTEPEFAMDRIHCMAVRCLDTGKKQSFVNDDLFPLSDGDIAELKELGHGGVRPLSEGFKLLEAAEYRAGHNIMSFDEDAIAYVYPSFDRDVRISDTLVMARMVFADIKETDFRMLAKGKLEGRFLGMQGLEAWGQRLGLAKGDYKKEREAELKAFHKEAGLEPPTTAELHKHVWGTWNPAMHDYMVLDVDVNVLLWEKIQEFDWSSEAVKMEHSIHALMLQQERNGFLMDFDHLKTLEAHLRGEYDRLHAAAVEHIGKWYRPAKKHVDAANGEHGEDNSRRTWGDTTLPKRTMNYGKARQKAIDAGQYDKMRPDTYEGAPFVKIELKEFNPNSRQQIEDRLRVLFGWEPQDFTDSGAAKVDDDILRTLAEEVPLADTLAEVFFMKKRLGQVSDGKNGWLKLMRADGRIHGRVNVGGTVSGRATHAAPNVSQVPGVNALEFKDHDKGLKFIAENEGQTVYNGKPFIVHQKWNDKKNEWAFNLRGRKGNYGWDCREAFTVPEGYKLVGCDLSGIEFRCLGNLTHPFDDGEIIDVVLNGDIHARNAELAGISRGVAKRLLYAAMYGGGDAKLGSIVEPFAPEPRQKSLGSQLRMKLMAAMPSLAQAIKEIKREKRRNSGTIRGLDGRRLYVRSDHAALNLRLQSDGALIAKKWCLIVDDLFWDAGWDHHVEAEYAFCSWSHDEIQVAVREDLADRAAHLMEAAAPMAGDHFGFKCPVAAESQVGMNWAETH